MGNTLWHASDSEGTKLGGNDAVPEPKLRREDVLNPTTTTTCIEIVVVGTGAGATYPYSRQSSSSFVVFKDGEPLLICDLGYGVTAACIELVGRVPPHVYISHNHGDHSGELPIVLSVESTAAAAEGRRPLTVYSHPDVMAEVQQHRLRELRSTGRPLDSFATFREVPCGQLTDVGGTGLAVRPFRSRHSETCYGLVLYNEGRPFLGWTADSGYDEALYGCLAEAPVLLVDARLKGSEEHAGFSQLSQIAELPGVRGKTLYVTGYGRQDEAPSSEVLPRPDCVQVARPGMRIKVC